MAAVQRLRQGVRALLAFSRGVDFDLAASVLNPAQMTLFRQMQRSEQLHSLNVLREILKQEPHTPHDLQVAALLHDVGKVRYPLAVWQKTLTVLVRAFLPAQFRKWSAGDPQNFAVRAFVVNVHHPAWSGEIMREIGAPERVVWLVTHHADPLSTWHDHPHMHLLRRLKMADDKH